MPWSEWVQSDPVEQGIVATYMERSSTFSDTQAGGDAQTVYDLADADVYDNPSHTVYGMLGNPPDPARDEAGSDNGTGADWTGTASQTQNIGWFDQSMLDLTSLDWSPPELDAMTEGVDYTVRPDRTGSEQDAYVEYEAGSPQHTGWYGVVSTQVIIDAAATASPPKATARVLLLSSPPTPPATPGFGETSSAGTPTIVMPGDGSTVAAVVEGVHGTADEQVISASLGALPEFALAWITESTSDAPAVVTGGSGTTGYTHKWSATQVADIRGLVTLPRWRYWIPGPAEPDVPLPLRQRQRNDGLGMSGAPRWRGGSSRQSSNRWRGYL